MITNFWQLLSQQMLVKSLPSCLSLSGEPIHPNCLPKHVASKSCGRKIKQLCITRPQILPSPTGQATGLRVFVLSDLHTDYCENMRWDRFEHVFYVPGNHDLWCRREEDYHLDSLEKLNKLLDACEGLGVQTSPMVIDGLGIIPMFSWYHESFDREKDITGIRIPPLEMACKDFHACKWPAELTKGDASLALYFDAMNDKHHDTIKEVDKECSHIISFSHFLPRQELCPEKRMLFYPNLPKIIGSIYLEARIRSIHGIEGFASTCHVFGHTHFCWDAVLDGIRYVQAPLAYPRERKRRMNGGEDWLPFCIYSDGKFADRISPCYWSDYYSANQRMPNITHDLAPWVARFYGQEVP